VASLWQKGGGPGLKKNLDWIAVNDTSQFLVRPVTQSTSGQAAKLVEREMEICLSSVGHTEFCWSVLSVLLETEKVIGAIGRISVVDM
jgi:hypothetical protein